MPKKSHKKTALGIAGLVLIIIPAFIMILPYMMPELLIWGYGLYLLAYPVIDYLLFLMIIIGMILLIASISLKR